MISSYRLGDLVCLSLSEEEKELLLKEHPTSIGGQYILEEKNNKFASKIDTITKIVLEHKYKYEDLLPKDISDSIVIHLRLGDVVAGNTDHEKMKRPLTIDCIKSMVSNDTNKKYVIGKCFFAQPSSTNYDECVQLSNNYLQTVLNELQAEHFDSGNADIDLCCAVSSKLFIQGKGYFSLLIVEIRKRLNLPSIETSVIDY